MRIRVVRTGFAPIIATQLLRFMNWRWIFVTGGDSRSDPGDLNVFRHSRPAKTLPRPAGHAPVPKGSWVQVLKNRNILLSMAALFCAMTGVFVLSAMLPSYLTDYLKLTPERMGFVASAVGFGGFVGQFALPGLSDVLGRRVVAVLGFLGAAIMLYLFIQTGANDTDCCLRNCSSRCSSCWVWSRCSPDRSPPNRLRWA